MKKVVTYWIVTVSLLSVQSFAFASDHHYRDDNAYFSSKYHYRHPHHWRTADQHKSKRPKHWGRHHHHGIRLDGDDGRP